MACPIGLIFPTNIYKQSPIQIKDDGVGLYDRYRLDISGTGINLSVLATITPTLSVSSSGLGAFMAIEGVGQANPTFVISSLPPGTYNYNYIIILNDDPDNLDQICEQQITGQFIVLDLEAPEPAPIGISTYEDSVDCLVDFIKFRTLTCPGMEFTPSTSDLYIEDFEGISLQSLAAITTDKYRSIQDLVNARVSLAMKLMVEEMIQRLPDNRFKQAVRSMQYGKFTDRYLPISSFYRGILLRKQYTPLSYFLIEGLSIKTNTTKTGHVIKIFENTLDNPVNLQTITVDLVAGVETKVKFNKKVYGHHVYIVSDNIDVEVNDSRVLDNCRSCDSSYDHYGYDFHQASGFDGENRTGNSYGLKIDYSIRCDKQLLFCKLAFENKMALFYRIGVELMKEWVTSDRLTPIKIYSKEWADAKIKEWYDLSNYYLEGSLDGMRDYLIDLDCLCLPCSGNKQMTILP